MNWLGYVVQFIIYFIIYKIVATYVAREVFRLVLNRFIKNRNYQAAIDMLKSDYDPSGYDNLWQRALTGEILKKKEREKWLDKLSNYERNRDI